jgi:hypothetical protein
MITIEELCEPSCAVCKNFTNCMKLTTSCVGIKMESKVQGNIIVRGSTKRYGTTISLDKG